MVSRPHGGRLVNRVARYREKERLLEEAAQLPRLQLTRDAAIEAENIARGVLSPLQGFQTQEDYFSVLDDMRLSDDTPWAIPIVLDADPEELQGVREGDTVALLHGETPIAVVRLEEIYGWDKREHAAKVYGTTDPAHPGVAQTMKMKELLVGGPLTLIQGIPPDPETRRYLLWPAETRILFREKRWRRIVGFQTRNVPHRGHEHVQKAALTFADGLFINPLVGGKKPGDWRDQVILAAYQALVKHYYPRDSTVLAVLRTRMRYAGPREAVHHAIMRKNYGCTHFIVGRDHAGVGNYYGPYQAWQIFQEFPDLGITPLFIREAFYCRRCGGIVNEKICPHPPGHRVRISGTQIRQAIKQGQLPPPEVMRPEVAQAILRFKKLFVEQP